MPPFALICILTEVLVIVSQSNCSTTLGDVRVGGEWRTTAQLTNDAQVLDYAKNKVVQLEQQLKAAKTDMEILRGRPSLSTQWKKYVLYEMEDSNMQLEGICFVDFSSCACVNCI